MEKERIHKIKDILNLSRDIVGVHFLVYENDYVKSSAEAAKGRNRMCGFVNLANKGKRRKILADNFSCTNGPIQMGLTSAPESHNSGQQMSHSGLYADLAIGREVVDSFSSIPQKIHGIEVGPLEDMDEADVIIMIGMAEQMMKVMEGYSYHYGVPAPFVSVGNAAMCSDLTAKPFMRNDINLSFMCCGARTSTAGDFGELGIGMPSHIFKNVADGIIKINE